MLLNVDGVLTVTFIGLMIVFPSQVEDILFDDSVNSEDEDFGSDVESDDDDEFEELLNK